MNEIYNNNNNTSSSSSSFKLMNEWMKINRRSLRCDKLRCDSDSDSDSLRKSSFNWWNGWKMCWKFVIKKHFIKLSKKQTIIIHDDKCAIKKFYISIIIISLSPSTSTKIQKRNQKQKKVMMRNEINTRQKTTAGNTRRNEIFRWKPLKQIKSEMKIVFSSEISKLWEERRAREVFRK